MSMAKLERLDKFLSHAGLAPRGKIKLLFKENEIFVNGKAVTNSATKIDPEKDIVTINGEQVVYEKFVYYILNKPYGIISTTSDELNRESVVDYIDTTRKIFPVGRLDQDTTGLLLLTDDGELTHKLLHPKYHFPKTYVVTIHSAIKPVQIKFLEKGVALSEGKTLPAKANILEESETETKVELTIVEGRYHQVKRMFASLGIEVTALKRIAFGPLKLGALQEGQYRQLTENEIEQLKKAIEK